MLLQIAFGNVDVCELDDGLFSKLSSMQPIQLNIDGDDVYKRNDGELLLL